MGQEGHSQREGRVAEKGREPTIPEFVMADRFAPIVLKNSLSAMFDFLGGLWGRHSKNQLGDQPI
jgi:hypothetical protein